MHRLMLSVIALLASSGLALAQAQKGPEPASPAAKETAPGQAKPGNGAAKQYAPGQNKQGGGSAKSDAPGQKNMDASESGTAGPTKKGKQADQRANQKEGEAGQNSRGKSSSAEPSAKSADTKDSGSSRMTTGSVKLNSEQRTKAVNIFGKHKVAPATNINVSVNVGTVVPKKVKLYALPQEILMIVPAYRSYRYFVYNDRVIIVEPSTYRIVDVIILA
jgi:hypothetical protein